MDVRENLVELLENHCAVIADENCKAYTNEFCTAHDCAVCLANHLIANGVTVQKQKEQGCPYCDVAKANEGVVNTALWVKEPETDKWTMMGKRLNFCPMCGRELLQLPKGE